MKAVQLLQAVNTISRYKNQLQQELAFVMLIENLAYHKLVEVHWAGEDGVWHTLRADYHSSTGTNREVWRAQATFNSSDDASLPGDVEFALRYRVLGEEYWDKNDLSNYFSNADSGVLLDKSAPVAPGGFQSHSAGGATSLSCHGRRTSLHATQARLHSLDDGQLAQHAGYALLLLQDALGQVAQERRKKPQSL